MRTLSIIFLLLFVYCLKAQVAVSIQPLSSPEPCKPITFEVTITNNGSSAITPTIQLDFGDAAVASFTAPDPLVCTSPAPTMEPPYVGSVEMTNNNAIAAGGGTASYTFTVTMTCASIPDGAGGNVPFTATVVNAGNSVTVNASANGNPGNATWLLVFPFITYSTGQTNTPVEYSPTAVHTIYYTNTGLASFDGCVQLDISDLCNLNVVSIEVFKNTIWGNADATFTGSSTASFCLSNIPSIASLANNEKLVFRIKYVYNGNSCGSAECTDIKFKLKWGCGGETCKEVPVATRTITAPAAPAPNVIVARILPAAYPGNGQLTNAHDYVWDRTCTSSSPASNALTWEFLVRNDGTMPANNVTITIDKAMIGSNTFIDGNSFIYNYNNQDANTTLRNRANAYGITTSNTGANWAITPYSTLEKTNLVVSDCFQTADVNFDVKTITINVPVLAVGERLLFRFNTHRCCSPNVDFNTGFYYNRWSLVSKHQNCAGQTVYSDVFNTTNIGAANPDEQKAVAISNTSVGEIVGAPKFNYLSIHPFDNGPDLALTQQAVGNNANLLGGHSACGEPDVYTVTNLTFTSNTNVGVAGFDQQIFSSATYPIDGPITDWIGALPRGIFRVEFVPTASLSIVGTPSIRKGGVNWTPVTPPITLTNGTVICDFDINSLIDIEPATNTQIKANGDAFRNFFIGSKITFEMKACCPLQGAEGSNQTCTVRTSFNPRPISSCATNACFLKLSRVIVPVSVRCPGCETPGAIVSKCELVRSTYGYQDVNGWGTADFDASMPGGLKPITASYDPLVKGQLNLKASIVDDELTSRTNVTFYPGGDDPLSTAVGYTYADVVTAFSQKLQCLYLEQQVIGPVDMPNGGIKAISGSGIFTITPNGSSTTYTYPLPSAQEIFTQVDGQTAKLLVSVYLQKLNNHLHNSGQLSSSINLEFNPGDKYTFTLKYKVVENPNGTPYSAKEITVWNWAYHTMQDLPTSYTAPYQSASNHIQTVGEINSGPPYGPVNPSTLALYYCEGLQTNHRIHPVVYEYTSQYVDDGVVESCEADTVQELRTDECRKLLHVNVKHYIWNFQPDLFPFEYRLIPGTAPANLNLGLPLVEAPTSTFPYGNFHVRFTLPSGFTPPSVLAGNTKSYTISQAYKDQVNVRRIQTNANTDLVFTPYTAIPNTWDMMVNYNTASYQALFTPGGTSGQARVMMGNGSGATVLSPGNIELFPILKSCPVVQICTTNNVLTLNQNRNLLAIGDEVFEHDFKIRLESPCSAMNGTEFPVEAPLVRTPVWDNGTDAMDDIKTTLNSGTFTKPDRTFTFASEGDDTICGNTATMPISITASAATSNLIIYVENSFVSTNGQPLPGVSVNALLRGTGTSATLLTPDPVLSTAALTAYRITNLKSGVNNFKIRLNINSCANLYDANGSIPLKITMGYVLSCEPVTEIFSASCTKGGNDFEMSLPPVLYTANYGISTTSLKTCTQTVINSTFISSGPGGVYNLKIIVDMPTNAELTNLLWKDGGPGNYYNVLTSNNLVYTVTPLSPGYVRYTIDFSPLVPIGAACTLGNDWKDGINNGELITIQVKFKIRCNNYLNPITVSIQGTQYCGDPIHLAPGLFGGYNVNNGIACQRPTVSLAPHNVTCIGLNNGYINTTVTSPANIVPSPSPYTFQWSNSSTEQNPHNLGIGVYTVTVTDANGCTATASNTSTPIATSYEPFSRYIENWDRCDVTPTDPFYSPGPPNPPMDLYWTPVIHDITTDKSDNLIVGGTYWYEVNFKGTPYNYRIPSGMPSGSERIGMFIAKYNEAGNMVFPPIRLDQTTLGSTFNYGGFWDLAVDVETDENNVVFAKMSAEAIFNAYNPTTGALIRSLDLSNFLNPGFNDMGFISYKIVDNFIYVLGNGYTGYPAYQTEIYFFKIDKTQFLAGASNPIIFKTTIADEMSAYPALEMVKDGSGNYFAIVGFYQTIAILNGNDGSLLTVESNLPHSSSNERVSIAVDKQNSKIYMTHPDGFGALSQSYTSCYSYSLVPPTAPTVNPVPVWDVQNDFWTGDLAVDENYVYTASADRVKKYDKTTGISQWGSTDANYQTWPNPTPTGCGVLANGIYSRTMSLTSDGRLYVAGPMQNIDVEYNGTTYTNHPQGNFILRYCTNSGDAYKTDETTDIDASIVQPIDSGGNSLLVFPNPSDNVFNLRAIGTDAEGEYAVMNAMGQKVAEGTLRQQAILDMSQQASGLYWITVRYNNPNLQDVSRKIILGGK